MTPARLHAFARVALCLGVALLAAFMLAPWDWLEAGLSAPVIQGLAFYLLTLGFFAVAPKQRRHDLAATAIGMAGVLEAAQAFAGREVALIDLIASMVGVGAAWLPGQVERFRHHVRTSPFLTLKQIRDADPRQAGRNRTPAEVLRALFTRPWMDRSQTPST